MKILFKAIKCIIENKNLLFHVFSLDIYIFESNIQFITSKRSDLQWIPFRTCTQTELAILVKFLKGLLALLAMIVTVLMHLLAKDPNALKTVQTPVK